MAELLVDEGIGRDLVAALVAQGFAAHHWLEFGQKGAHDSLVFLEAQRRQLTVFSYNRDDYRLLAAAWRNWGHGNHYGIITRPKGAHQLSPVQTLHVMAGFCVDTTSFINRIEYF